MKRTPNKSSPATASKNVQLIDSISFYGDNETGTDLDTEAGNEEAVTYALKNLSDDATFERVTNGDKVVAYTLKDKWAVIRDTKITLTPSLYKIGETFYYVVHLQENVGHLFLGGFRGMEAPVVSIAKLTKTADTDPETPKPEEVVPEEVVEKIETAKNTNVIIGNWEVQDYYRWNTSNSNDVDTTTTDSSGNTTTQIKYLTREQSFIQRFGFELYVSAWNMFQDTQVHFKSVNAFRTETINVFDDVTLKNYNASQDKKYADSNVVFGTKGSSVRKTKAASNGIELEDENGKEYLPYTYNTPGNPYIAEDLDSIDIDFQAEVRFKEDSIYPFMDWDLQLGYDKWSNNYADGTGQSTVGVKAWQDHLRIHSSINFGAPYPERDRYEKTTPDDRDILWVRIESEPILNAPDAGNGYTTTNINGGKGMYALNSVRQIMINFTKANTGPNDRPIVIFYDGPERYAPLTEKSLRDSKPVIVQLQADTNAILYLPNSPVVFIDNGYKFNGFIVAKSYMRLKTAADFEAELKDDPDKYTVTGTTYKKNAAEDNPYYCTQHGSFYRDNGEPQKINWTYTQVTENGMKLYVDDYGNVQFMELKNPPKKYGTYATFGRTDFTTHNYTLSQTSAYNLLLSS